MIIKSTTDLKGRERSKEPYVTKSYKIFGFKWKQFQVLFLSIGRDIIKLFFSIRLWISQERSQFLDFIFKMH